MLGTGGRFLLGERRFELLDLGAQCIALLGRLAESPELLARRVELRLDSLLLGGELVVPAGAPLTLLVVLRERAIALGDGGLGFGESALHAVELGRELSALVLQPGEILVALVAGLGERRLQSLDLGRCECVLFLQAAQALFVLGARLGESRFEPLDVGARPLRLGDARPEGLDLRSRLPVLLAPLGKRLLVLGLRLGKGVFELLDVDRELLPLARAGTRVGERALEALDLGVQLLELCKVAFEAPRLVTCVALGRLGNLLNFLDGFRLDALLGLGRRSLFGVFLDDFRLRRILRLRESRSALRLPARRVRRPMPRAGVSESRPVVPQSRCSRPHRRVRRRARSRTRF